MQAKPPLDALQRLRPSGQIGEQFHLHRAQQDLRGPKSQAYLQNRFRRWTFVHYVFSLYLAMISGRSSKEYNARAVLATTAIHANAIPANGDSRLVLQLKLCTSISVCSAAILPSAFHARQATWWLPRRSIFPEPSRRASIARLMIASAMEDLAQCLGEEGRPLAAS